MSYSIDVAAARALATKVHEGQTDKAGLPYITHPERVVSRMENPEAQVIGWLHDTVEDTPITLRDIEATFGPKPLPPWTPSVEGMENRGRITWSVWLQTQWRAKSKSAT